MRARGPGGRAIVDANGAVRLANGASRPRPMSYCIAELPCAAIITGSGRADTTMTTTIGLGGETRKTMTARKRTGDGAAANGAASSAKPQTVTRTARTIGDDASVSLALRKTVVIAGHCHRLTLATAVRSTRPAVRAQRTVVAGAVGTAVAAAVAVAVATHTTATAAPALQMIVDLAGTFFVAAACVGKLAASRTLAADTMADTGRATMPTALEARASGPAAGTSWEAWPTALQLLMPRCRAVAEPRRSQARPRATHPIFRVPMLRALALAALAPCVCTRHAGAVCVVEAELLL